MYESRVMESTGSGWRYATLALLWQEHWHERGRPARESALRSKAAQKQRSGGVVHGAVALLGQELRLNNVD